MRDFRIPLDIPSSMRSVYEKNIMRATQSTGRLMLFAGDQKVEHLNDDFAGEGIDREDANPEHLFRIASKARIGAFATQMGLIAQYGMDYPKVPYIIKLNSKTNLVKTTQKDPISESWYTIGDILEFRKTSKLPIVGIGYTIYLGSEFESIMLAEAAKLIYAARYHGLLSIIWIYPRGKAVIDEKEPHLIAGAAGVACALGADFVKVNAPKKEGISSAEALKEAVQAAGRTRLICAGGGATDVEKFLTTLYDQIHIGGTSGNATGRNIHQKPLEEAIRFCNAISAITFDNKSVSEAFTLYHG